MSSLITKKRRGRPRSTRQKKGKAAILTLGEVMRQDNLPMEEAAVECRRICGKVHEDENTHCFRYLNGHQLCAGCQKYSREQGRPITEEWRRPY